MTDDPPLDYEGLRLAAEEAIRGRSRSQVARERYLSPQAVSAACNAADCGLTKVQIRLIEAYTSRRVIDLGNGRFRLASVKMPPVDCHAGDYRLRE